VSRLATSGCMARDRILGRKVASFVNSTAGARRGTGIVAVMTVVTERRLVVERRQRNLRAYWQGAQRVRRKAGRRAADSLYPIVDRYSPRVVAAALGIMVLCCCDGLLTLRLIGQGAIEVNPVMAFLMTAGMGWFSAVKFLLTALGVVILAACSAMRLFGKIPGEALLHALLGCYVVLLAYEAWLIRWYEGIELLLAAPGA